LITKRLLSLLLLLGFALSLFIASSAKPLRAQTTSDPVVTAKSTVSRHFVGGVTAVNADAKTFTLETGTRKFLIVTTSLTKYFTFSPKKEATFAQIKVGVRVAVLGEVNGSTLTAKLVAIGVKTSKRHANHGKIVSLSSSVITFQPSTKKNTTLSFNVTATTVYTKKVNGKIARVQLSDLSVGDRITFVGTVDDNGVITAKLVHVIPGKATGQTATSSAR
jgi:hypothetical protein